MKKQKLVLYNEANNSVRTIIKTNHGRLIFLELSISADKFNVKNCVYIDRIRSGTYYATPQKLVTKIFDQAELLDVVATELDRKYYGVEYSNEYIELSTGEFIEQKLMNLKRNYKFLIFIGEGEHINGLPSILTTRLANRLHRKIYLKIKYYKDGVGIIEDCYYFDRKYKARKKVVPQMLTSIFVEYNRTRILDIVNRELDCDFTDVIIADSSIDIEENAIAICGNI